MGLLQHLAVDVTIPSGDSFLDRLMAWPGFWPACGAIVITLILMALWKKPKVFILVFLTGAFTLWLAGKGVFS